jgi:hypothetical protein
MLLSQEITNVCQVSDYNFLPKKKKDVIEFILFQLFAIFGRVAQSASGL